MEQKLLSIYIGNDVTRICEVVKKSSTSIIVNNATEVSTPGGSIDDGYITDVNAIAEAIRGCVFGRGFSASKVIFTISSKKIANKEIVIPYVKGDKKISQIISANSSEYFPMSATGDFVFAHSVMENFQDNDGKKTRITAIAAPKDLVEGYYEIAEELKLSVESIDYVGNSVLQLLSLQMKDDSTELVLQIEKDVTFVNVMSGKDIILQRSVPYGKNAVINSMMEVKKLTEKEAKALLSNKKAIEEQVTEEEYAEVVRYLISSIGRIVEYHRSRNPERIIDGIKVFGEGSSIEGIDEVLQQELGAEVTHFTQLAGVKVSGKAYLTSETALRYLANFGAVLNPIGLNVTTGKDKEKAAQSMNKLLYAALALAVLVMVGICSVQLIKYFTLDMSKKLIEADIAAKEDIEAIAQDYENAVASYNIVKEFTDGTVSDNELILELIQTLEQTLPDTCKVEELNAVDGMVTVKIVSVTKDAYADIIVELEKKDFVAKVEVAAISNAELVNTDPETSKDMPTITGEVSEVVIYLVNNNGTDVSDEVQNALSLAGSSVQTEEVVEEGGAE
ncbi:MAG: pilus assembly protein PilM [Lachnospiraceae bacterium]|nr:pilus assembly protein PilM [Lachnospiraceae bacterium]